MKTALIWNPQEHSLGQSEMDATHEEFVALVNTALAADDAGLGAAMATLLSHTQAHFERESALMAECGLGSRLEHEADHRRVLGELTNMQARAARGRPALVRPYLAEGIPHWLRSHLATMDADLAAALLRQNA
ncbi:MAG TPA: hemerythrin family protein [Rhodocyclaceae bacterium]